MLHQKKLSNSIGLYFLSTSKKETRIQKLLSIFVERKLKYLLAFTRERLNQFYWGKST